MQRKALGLGLGVSILALIAAAPTGSRAQDGAPITCGTSYVIARGDSLSSIAKVAYGDPKRFDVLFEANREVIGDDPGNVALGTSIVVPCLDASGQPMTSAEAAEAKADMEAAIASVGPLEPAELDTLFGPVALFPDPLLTQVMMAATYPLDVVKADRFVKQSAALSDKERADAAEKEPWDPSVRQLAAGFPDLITRMTDHIDWTEQAGEAVIAQTEDVLDSIQRLRAKAMENGYLTDNEAQDVEETDDLIYIAPADPEVVYVPVYDSQVIYSTPIAESPYYDTYYYGYDNDDWSDALAAGAIIFGGALILDEIFDDDDHWGDWWHDGGSIDWDTGDINIDRGDINIDGGDINIGDGDRPGIGDGERPGIGDGDRPNIGDRPPRPTTLPGRVGGAEGDALSGTMDRKFTPDAASREVARQKIETRKATVPSLADLPPSRPSTKAATRLPTAGAATKARPSAGSRPTAKARPSNVSRPTKSYRPSAGAGYKSKPVTAFETTGGRRASAGASRGRSSSGVSRSGGGRRR